jgi:hypothetical protein
MGRLVGLVLVIVACVVALHWAYELLRSMLWLIVLIGVLVGAAWVWRQVSGWRS